MPGEAAGTVFNKFGEALSVGSDGRYVAYWGAWGTGTTPKTLYCPQDGEANVIAYCLQYANGTVVNVPVHQGIFVIDTRNNTNTAIAKTGQYGMQDFVYWVFSGQPPGTGGGDEGDGEPPRWRSSAFAALSGKFPYGVRIAYKANRSGVDGIYMYRNKWAPFVTVAEIGASGTAIDPLAPAGFQGVGAGNRARRLPRGLPVDHGEHARADHQHGLGGRLRRLHPDDLLLLGLEELLRPRFTVAALIHWSVPQGRKHLPSATHWGIPAVARHSRSAAVFCGSRAAARRVRTCVDCRAGIGL